VGRGAALAPASVASLGGRSHARAPVAQMVVLLKPPNQRMEDVDLKMNLSHMSVVWSEEMRVIFL